MPPSIAYCKPLHAFDIPFTMLIFYDNSTYKIGDKKKSFLELDNTYDIDQLNLIQFLNSKSLIFFNAKATEPYLKKILDRSTQFKKANQAITDIFPLQINTTNVKIKDQVIRQGTTDCKINLSIDNISQTKKAKHHVLSENAAQLRPKAAQLAEVFFGKQIKLSLV